jgi:asparagine synthase (glutamine-hydrolysing)
LSGIVGIFGRDGVPVDRPLLQALTHSQSYRGPDACEVWADRSVGLGHTLLRTTYESLAENQPASLERKFWITADARIDCRAELVAELTNAGRKFRQAAPDPELILHAYAAWGEACVQHLKGDFAFAIWDAPQEILFCARDHFGVKPFYYAELGETFLFSNTLDCLRVHADLSDELDDSAIADFLLFGLNCDESTTTFRDIRRLPPAHVLCVSAAGIRSERYWSPPTDGRIRYHRPGDYVEHFQTLMQSAVADRLRTSRAGIWLSGGMDSSSIAAMARELSAKAGGTSDLRAYTVVYDSLIPDRERDHARTVAEFLGIPIRCFAMDDLQLFERWNDPTFSFPEPVEDPFAAALFDHHAAVASDCRVVLSGDAGDELMYFQMWPYTRDLLRNRHWRRLFQDTSQFLRLRQFPSRGIRRRIQALFGSDSGSPEFPSWLAPQLSRRLRLEERWSNPTTGKRAKEHPIVPKAHASLSGPRWTRLFELADPGLTHSALEVRYPFLDLRVVNFLLAIPPFPWTFQKRILREAASGHLPESIRLRPKTPLDGEPLMEILRRPDAAWVDDARWSEQIERYITPGALPRLNGQNDSACVDIAVRAHCLNFWLQSSRGVRYNNYAEARNG